MRRTTILAILCLWIVSPAITIAQASEGNSAFNGAWVINEELSDDTDKQVEKAIKAAGGKPTKRKGKGRYKGGPKEQALYDHISYDEILRIQYNHPRFHLAYAEGFERTFYTDGRSRSFSARGSRRERQDYSFASWDGERKFIVESRPRDGGRTTEMYSLTQDGKQMRVELYLEPLSFLVPIEIVRVYDRAGQAGTNR